jgi:hypothetical protein
MVLRTKINNKNNIRPNIFNLRIAVGMMILLAVTVAVLSGGAAAETRTVSENETIQEVINNASDGDVVKIPSGEYQTELTINKDITLSGTGEAVLDGADERYDVAIFIESGSVTVEDITIQGYGEEAIYYSPTPVADELELTVQDATMVNNDASAIELDADNIDANVTIDAVEARNNRAVVDVVSVVGEVTIQNSEFISNWAGIEGNPTELTIEETTISRSANSGVEIYQSESVSITDSTVTDNGADRDEDNIYVDELPANSQVTIESVDASNAYDNGISIVGPQATVSISDIDARSNGGVGIYVEAQSTTIEDVTSTANGHVGLNVIAETSEIHNVDASENDGGITVEGSETEISEVEITPNDGEFGIHTIDLQSVTVENADIAESDESNIYIESSASKEDISIRDSSVRQSASVDGIHIQASSSSRIELAGITATGNADDGLSIIGGEATITDFEASDNGGVGVYISSIRDVSLSEVTATGNDEQGVLLEEIGTTAAISGSIISDNSGYEIENNAAQNIAVSDSLVGLIGDVDDEYISGNIILESTVSTENPELESGVAADFTIDPTPPRAGETVTFDASPTRVVGGAEATYEWDLNADGSTDATGQLTDWSFDQGTEEVTLTVVDTDGREDAVTKEFAVTPSGINAQISTTKTELTTDEQTAIEYSIANYLTSEESDVQMIVEYPSGIQVSSTRGLDASSNQATLTETVDPGDQESFRVTITPNAPGTYEVTAIANYQSTDGAESGEVTETATFEVTEPVSDSDVVTESSETQTDDDSPGFGAITVCTALILGSLIATRHTN